MNTKKDIFQKHKHQNPNPRTPRNSQYTHNRIKKPKKQRCVFESCVKTEEAFSSQDQKLVETTKLWQLFSDKKLPPSKSAYATIAKLVELVNGTTMNTSR